MRVHVPILLALSANSPFWRGGRHRPGLDPDADLPRLPRVGIPPYYEDGTTYERRIGFMVERA
jgi:carboxylate-amine ligase